MAVKKTLKGLMFFLLPKCYQTVKPHARWEREIWHAHGSPRSLTKPKNMRKTVQTKNEATILGKAAKGLVIIDASSTGISGD
jgi:hypothetical protein